MSLNADVLRVAETLRAEQRAVSDEIDDLTVRLRALNARMLSFDRALSGLVELYPALELEQDSASEDDMDSLSSAGVDVNVGVTKNGNAIKRIGETAPVRGPRSREASMIVLEENRGEWLTVEDVIRKVEEHGWELRAENPVQAYRVALGRLAQDDKVLRRRSERSRFFEFALPNDPREMVALAGLELALDAESPAVAGLSDLADSQRRGGESAAQAHSDNSPLPRRDDSDSGDPSIV